MDMAQAPCWYRKMVLMPAIVAQGARAGNPCPHTNVSVVSMEIRAA